MDNLWHLDRIDWLKELPDGTAARLRASATVSTFEAGSPIFEPSSSPAYAYILETGLVRIYRTSEQGGEVTLGYIRPGEVFGELAALSDSPRESYARALERSVVIRVGRDAFANAIRSCPEVCCSVAVQVGGRLKRLESRVEDLVFRSAPARIASTLLQLADDFGEALDGGVRVGLRITQVELASLVGVSRPTVNIALGEFEALGLLRREGGQIVLTDRAGLKVQVSRGA